MLSTSYLLEGRGLNDGHPRPTLGADFIGGGVYLVRHYYRFDSQWREMGVIVKCYRKRRGEFGILTPLFFTPVLDR